MKLDLSARRNLELTETIRGREKRGTLLWVLDKTNTYMGRRLLRSYVDRPLLDPVKIEKRLSAVETFINDPMLGEDIASELYTAPTGDPDIIIRTGGDTRLSNFLLWQASYAELYFTPTLWPDFSKEELYEIFRRFSKTNRRYGGYGTQAAPRENLAEKK